MINVVREITRRIVEARKAKKGNLINAAFTFCHVKILFKAIYLGYLCHAFIFGFTSLAYFYVSSQNEGIRKEQLFVIWQEGFAL